MDYQAPILSAHEGLSLSFDPALLHYLTPAERAEALVLLEEQERQAARVQLAAFAPYVWPRYKVERFHRLLADTLDRVVRGEIRRLMVFAPPQHGKSLLTSSIFPAYWLAHRPHEPIIIGSYGKDLATEKSAAARQIVESNEYATLFPGVTTRMDSRAKDAWRLTDYEGGVRAAGVNVGVTGHPAGLAIIDDPVKDYEQAMSQTYRDEAWNWYDTTLFSRLWETAPIVVIQTRWHEDDLAGRILARDTSETWTIVRLPALAETQAERDEANRRLGMPAGLPDPLGREAGEALAPKRYSRPYLERLRDSGSSYRWQALYQGSPRAAEGNMIKRDWLKLVDAVPYEAERILYIDKAGTEGGGARTALVLMAKSGGLYFVEDVIYGQWSAGQREEIIKQQAILCAQRYVKFDPDHPEKELWELEGYNQVKIYVEQEPGSGGKESAEATIRNLAGYPVYADRVTGKKEVRIEPFAAQAEAGNIRLKRAIWNEVYIDELISFPNGMYKDMADASSGAFNLLHVGGFTFAIAGEEQSELPGPKPGREVVDEAMERGWRRMR